jgi:hypothetical protein
MCEGGFSVFAGVGERTREGNDLYKEMIESGVIKLGEKQVNFFTLYLSWFLNGVVTFLLQDYDSFIWRLPQMTFEEHGPGNC